MYNCCYFWKRFYCFFKWAIPGLFLFIFVLFKHKFYRKYVLSREIQTQIIAVEGEHANHLTTTTAQCLVILILSLSQTVAGSVTRFGEFSPLRKIFKVLHNFLRVYLLLGKILDWLWQISCAIGQVFIDINGQMLKNNLAIWSHWLPVLFISDKTVSNCCRRNHYFIFEARERGGRWSRLLFIF